MTQRYRVVISLGQIEEMVMTLFKCALTEISFLITGTVSISVLCLHIFGLVPITFQSPLMLI